MSRETEAVRKLTRPIIGIENRTPQEAQDILFDRIRSHFAAWNARQQAEARATAGAADLVELDLFLATYAGEGDDDLVNRNPCDPLLTWGVLRRFVRLAALSASSVEALDFVQKSQTGCNTEAPGAEGADTPTPEAPGSEEAGWIVGNNVGQWRTFDSFGWAWTDRRDLAVRYARREDAELVHGDDEDSWRVEQYTTRLALNEREGG